MMAAQGLPLSGKSFKPTVRFCFLTVCEFMMIGDKLQWIVFIVCQNPYLINFEFVYDFQVINS